MSSASVVQLALEESKRQLKKADEKRKATQAEVEGLLAEIEAVRADMCQRSQRHAERQSRLGAIEQRHAALQRDRMLRIEGEMSSSLAEGRSSWKAPAPRPCAPEHDSDLSGPAGSGRKLRETPASRLHTAAAPDSLLGGGVGCVEVVGTNNSSHSDQLRRRQQALSEQQQQNVAENNKDLAQEMAKREADARHSQRLLARQWESFLEENVMGAATASAGGGEQDPRRSQKEAASSLGHPDVGGLQRRPNSGSSIGSSLADRGPDSVGSAQTLEGGAVNAYMPTDETLVERLVFLTGAGLLGEQLTQMAVEDFGGAVPTHCVPELYSRIRLLQDRRGWG